MQYICEFLRNLEHSLLQVTDKGQNMKMLFNKLPPKFVATYKREMRMYQFIGVDVFDELERSAFEKYLRMIVIISMVTFILSGAVLYIVNRNEDCATFLDVVHTIPSTFVLVQNLIKFAIVVKKKKEIKECIEDICKLWPVVIDNEEKMQELDTWSRSLVLIDNVYYRATQFIAVFFCVVPLGGTLYTWYSKANTEYKYLMGMSFFCNIDSFYSYLPAYSSQVMTCIVIQMCMYMTTDVTLVGMTLQLISLFSFLRIDLQNLSNGTNIQSFDFNIGEDCQEIKSIVKTHQRLLSLAERINKIFGVIIFSQVSFSSIVICCYGFIAIMQLKDGFVFVVGNLTASLGIMFSIFVLAWTGQQLSDMSSGVGDSAYQCPWYDRSKKFRKYIAIIINRARKPSLLSALGFSDITLLMFSKVLATSWSYLSFLNQMSEELDI